MTEPTVHVIGAGVAGLAAAVRLVRRGRPVRVHEAAPRAGGRCRSWHDGQLDLVIDNGNHLMMRANPALLDFVADCGGRARLVGPAPARFAFVDLAAGRRWTVAPNAGPLPWWVLVASRRIPGTRARDYLALRRFLKPPRGATVAELMAPDHPLWRPFVEPLTLAVLNTRPERADAGLLARVLAATFARGERACRPLIAERGLASELIDPATAFLASAGRPVEHGRRLRALDFDGPQVRALDFGGERLVLGPADRVVLAAPVQAARDLVPGLATPGDGETILNLHFRLPDGAAEAPVGFVGLLGATAHWIFRRGAVASVTVSAAGDLDNADTDALVATLWRETVQALDLPGPADDPPPHRLIRERRATFGQAPGDVARRPDAVTRWTNLVLAGDWTNTGLPATLEGAAQSGHTAAQALAAGAAAA